MSIDRRKFIERAGLSVAGIAWAPRAMGTSRSEEAHSSAPLELMKEVMSYRKIDAHAHVFFSDDSPATQIGLADRLGIEKLVISRPMAPGSQGLPEEFIGCNDLVLKAVKKHPDRFIGQPTINP